MSSVQTCHICFSNITEGASFCGECGTECKQIEVLDLEFIQDMATDNTAKVHTKLPGQSKAKMPAKAKTQKKKNVIAQWATCEGLNVLLRHWTEILIQNGASSNLKNVVCDLWCSYLQRNKVAFVNHEEKHNPKIKNFSTRDKIIAGHDAAKKCKRTKKVSKPKSQRSFQLKKSFSSNEISRCMDGLSETIETVHDDTEFLLEQYQDVSSSDDVKKKKKSGEPENWYCNSHPEVMNIERIFVILYLAILQSDEDILLLDLIRWTREGHLPYSSCSKIVSKVYQMSPEDAQAFCLRSLLGKKVGREIYGLCLYMGWKQISYVDPAKVAKRMVEALKLPDEVCDLVLEVFRLSHVREHNGRCYPPIEVICGAALMMVFRMTFGLDDCHEIYLDSWASKLNEKFQSIASHSVKLFSFLEWHKYMNTVLRWRAMVNVNHQAFSFISEEMDVDRLQHYCMRDGIYNTRLSKAFLGPGTESEDKFMGTIADVSRAPERESDLQDFLPMYRNPFTGMLDAYINGGYYQDPGKDKDDLLKKAKELSNVTFKNHVFDWIHDSDVIRKEFESIGVETNIILTSLSNKNQGSSKNYAGLKILIPDPMQNYSKVPYKTRVLNYVQDLPLNFLWFAEIIAKFCETSPADMLAQYRSLESSVIKTF